LGGVVVLDFSHQHGSEQMTRIKTVLVSSTLGIALATGIAFAQGSSGLLFGPPDLELKAALESLEDALTHLQRARNSDKTSQARDHVERAMAAIDPNFNSFAAPVAPPPAPRAPK
jgi:hypothetical protein